MFGVQFYPTPTKLVDRMLDLVDWERVKFALEPSAGKGDIIKNNGSDEACLAWNTRAPILSAEEIEMLEGMK